VKGESEQQLCGYGACRDVMGGEGERRERRRKRKWRSCV